MADKIVPRDYTETAGVPAAARKEIWNPDTGVNEYVEHQKEFEDGLYLSSSRIAMQELTSVAITGTGWKRIAEVGQTSNKTYNAVFSITSRGGFREDTYTFRVAGSLGSSSKKLTIETLSRGYWSETNNGFLNARIAKSDVATSGAWIEIYFDISVDVTVTVQMTANAQHLIDNLTLIPIVATGVNCPDGVTAATFLEAGAELSLNVTNVTTPMLMGYRANSDDILNCSVIWPEIPKQGTSLTITLPSTSLRFKSLNETNSAIVASHTISNFNIIGNIVEFRINQTGISTGMLDFAHAFVLITGSGCKLTIT